MSSGTASSKPEHVFPVGTPACIQAQCIYMHIYMLLVCTHLCMTDLTGRKNTAVMQTQHKQPDPIPFSG